MNQYLKHYFCISFILLWQYGLELDETLKRLQEHNGVQGIVSIDKSGKKRPIVRHKVGTGGHKVTRTNNGYRTQDQKESLH